MGQAQEAWITAHVNAYSFFGGVTRILVPDNLKTGVIKHTRRELVLNRSYQELAERTPLRSYGYGTAIIPARVKKPKDKATVEGTVGIVSTFILAAIRNQRFFTLRELNEVIKERLHLFNHKAFQKKDGRFRAESTLIGVNTAAVAESILTSYKVEQQGYKTWMTLLKLAEQYTPERLEAACSKAFFYTPRPSIKSIQTILKTGQRTRPASRRPRLHPRR